MPIERPWPHRSCLALLPLRYICPFPCIFWIVLSPVWEWTTRAQSKFGYYIQISAEIKQIKEQTDNWDRCFKYSMPSKDLSDLGHSSVNINSKSSRCVYVKHLCPTFPGNHFYYVTYTLTNTGKDPTILLYEVLQSAKLGFKHESPLTPLGQILQQGAVV